MFALAELKATSKLCSEMQWPGLHVHILCSTLQFGLWYRYFPRRSRVRSGLVGLFSILIENSRRKRFMYMKKNQFCFNSNVMLVLTAVNFKSALYSILILLKRAFTYVVSVWTGQGSGSIALSRPWRSIHYLSWCTNDVNHKPYQLRLGGREVCGF